MIIVVMYECVKILMHSSSSRRITSKHWNLESLRGGISGDFGKDIIDMLTLNEMVTSSVTS